MLQQKAIPMLDHNYGISLIQISYNKKKQDFSKPLYPQRYVLVVPQHVPCEALHADLRPLQRQGQAERVYGGITFLALLSVCSGATKSDSSSLSSVQKNVPIRGNYIWIFVSVQHGSDPHPVRSSKQIVNILSIFPEPESN